MAEDLITLFRDLKAEKEGAFDRFLDQVQQRVFSFSQRVCGNREDAKDTLQETLLAAFRSLPEGSFHDEKALNVWLYKVAKNACLMMRRKRKHDPERVLSLDDFMPVKEPGKALEITDWSNLPEQEALKEETRRMVQHAVSLLPENYRVVLVLRDMQQLSTAETAEVLDITEMNVKARLHRARLFLRQELEQYYSNRRNYQ